MKSLLSFALFSLTAVAQSDSLPRTLDAMRDRYRPILIFTPSNNDAFKTQMATFSAGLADLHTRDVVLVVYQFHDYGSPWSVTFKPESMGIMPISEQDAARTRFKIGPNEFAVIALGKDGQEKMRWAQPVTVPQIDQLIDAMPGRKDEVRDSHSQ